MAAPSSLPICRPRFDASSAEQLASRYLASLSKDDSAAEQLIETVIAPAVRLRGHFERDEFLRVCLWKTSRSRRLCVRNSEGDIQSVTRFAFLVSNERIRINALMLLEGVSWPTASVLLHFGHTEGYPIIDFRALWSLGLREPSTYSFDFWWCYVTTCRTLAREWKIPLRTLDRALWQFSTENQSPVG